MSTIEIKVIDSEVKISDIAKGLRTFFENSGLRMEGKYPIGEFIQNDSSFLSIKKKNGTSWNIEILIDSNKAKDIYRDICDNPATIINQKFLTLMQDSGISKEGDVYLHNLFIEKGLSKIFNVRREKSANLVLEDNKLQGWIGAPSVKDLINFWEGISAGRFSANSSIDDIKEARVESNAALVDVNKADDENVNGWVYQSAKQGGANSAGEKGGIYKRGNLIALVKQDKDVTADMREFLASKIFQETSPGNGAEVFLMNVGEKEQSNKGVKNIYIGSRFFSNYKDLYIDAHEVTSNPVPKDRPKNVGTFNRRIFKEALSKDEYKHYLGFSESMVTSLLLGDFDVHWGNVGVVEQNNKKRLVRIDFGAALKGIRGHFEPHSIKSHLPGFGPTNHFREYPEAMKFNQEFIKELKRVSEVDLTECLNQAFESLNNHYGMESMRELSKSIGMNKPSEDYKEIIKYLNAILKERQHSLRDFATEIEVDLYFRKNAEDKRELKGYRDEDGSLVSIKKIIDDNPEYFKKVINGEKRIHLRSKEYRGRDKWWYKVDIFGVVGRIYKSYFEKEVGSIIKSEYKESINNTRQQKGIEYSAANIGSGCSKSFTKKVEKESRIIKEKSIKSHGDGVAGKHFQSYDRRS